MYLLHDMDGASQEAKRCRTLADRVVQVSEVWA